MLSPSIKAGNRRIALIAAGTALAMVGAAYAAGLAVGYWKDLAEIAALWEKDLVFEPRMGRDEAQARLADWNAAVKAFAAKYPKEFAEFSQVR